MFDQLAPNAEVGVVAAVVVAVSCCCGQLLLRLFPSWRQVSGSARAPWMDFKNLNGV